MPMLLSMAYVMYVEKKEKLMDFSDFHGFFNALLSLFSLTDNSNKTIVDIIQDEWHIFKR